MTGDDANSDRESIPAHRMGCDVGFVYRPFSVREDSPTRFALKYKKELDESAVLHVALGCSVVGLDANDGRSRRTIFALKSTRAAPESSAS